MKQGIVSELFRKMVGRLFSPFTEILDDSLNRQVIVRSSDVEFASSNPNIEAISDDPHSGEIVTLPDGFESYPRQYRHPHNRL
jgi:hypothetical protein